MRGVMSYMQRTAIQGTPDILSEITQRYVPNATPTPTPDHPFRRSYHQLTLGEQLITPEREITIEDIETFAHFTGDTFYAHMDAEAAKRNPFFPIASRMGICCLVLRQDCSLIQMRGPFWQTLDWTNCGL